MPEATTEGGPGAAATTRPPLARGPSLRLQIVLVTLLPFLAFLPVVVLTNHVLKVVLERTETIVHRDMQVEAVLDALARDVLVARSEIKSFLLDGAVRHFEANREYSSGCPDHVRRLGELLGPDRRDVIQLGELVHEYAWRSDSLLAQAVRTSAREVSGSVHFRRLDEITDELVATVERTRTSNAEAIEANRRGLSILAVRARRDVIMALILTLLVEVVLIALLPRRLLRPLQQLERTLRKAMQGRLEARAEIGPGEFGSLGVAINRLLETFQRSDTLARNKIAEVSNRFRLIAAQLPYGVLVLDADLVPIYANAWILERRGWSETEFAAATLDALFDAEGLAHRLTTQMLRPEAESILIRLRTPQGSLPVSLQCRIVLDRGGDLANLVVFLRESAEVAATTSSPSARGGPLV